MCCRKELERLQRQEAKAQKQQQQEEEEDEWQNHKHQIQQNLLGNKEDKLHLQLQAALTELDKVRRQLTFEQQKCKFCLKCCLTAQNTKTVTF